VEVEQRVLKLLLSPEAPDGVPNQLVVLPRREKVVGDD
jgi:hypothetical protein